MQPVKINCSHCNQALEYWTMEDYIYCPKCHGTVTVEPCTEPLDNEMPPKEENTEGTTEGETIEETPVE